MKPGVTIINTARGKLIDSDALIAGLESWQDWRGGLDVLENENGLYYYDRMGDVIPNPELAVLRSHAQCDPDRPHGLLHLRGCREHGARRAGKRRCL